MNNTQEVEYRLCNDLAPVSAVQKTGPKGDLLTLFKDPKKKQEYNRAIRHCPNERSIYIDEQSDFANVEPIVFVKGFFKIKPNEKSTILFMEAHPDNKANGGKVFEVVDDEIEAEESLEIEDLIVDLKSLVREKQKGEDGLAELQTAAAAILGSYVKTVDKSMAELRKDIYMAIDANPYNFVDDGKLTLFDVSAKRTYLALRALGEGHVEVSIDGRSLLWSDTKALITAIPVNEKASEYFAEYLATDDGMLVMDKILNTI